MYDKYLPETYFDSWAQTDYYNKMFHKLETEVLYALVRGLKPSRIVEISPNKGFTSFVMLGALKKNDKPAELLSFDIIANSEGLDCDGVVKRKLTVGDARDMSLDVIDECDFLFIDSEHTYEFAAWYCDNIIPRLRPGTLIWIHDWNSVNTKDNPEIIRVLEAVEDTPPLLLPVVNLMEKYGEFTGTEINWETCRRGVWKWYRSPSQICIKT
jgi:hypothetical protein